jgi:hypothetical protein
MPEPRDPTGERIGAAIRAAAESVDAPHGLRERIAADRARQGSSRRRRLRPAILVAAASVAAVVVAALVIVLGSGGSASPTVADAATVALGASTAPPPAVDAGDPRFVDASVGGIRFPNYAYDTPWRTVGGRADDLGPRSSRTVTYAKGPVRVGYTIVDGTPLDMSAGAWRTAADGTPVWLSHVDGARVVSWEREGRTCVLASRQATEAQMLDFVAWHEDA